MKYMYLIYIYIFKYVCLLGFGAGGLILYIFGGMNRGGNGPPGIIKAGCRSLPIGGICPLIGTIGLITIGLGGKF